MVSNIEDEKIVAICTAFNEETRVGPFIDRFKETDKKLVDTILIVNDGSTDSTKEVSEKHGATVVSHEKRRGLGCALRTGIEYALENNYSIIVFIAPNGKDNPLEIPVVLEPILNDNADYVQGSRYMTTGHSKENMSFLRYFATKIHPLLIRFTTGFQATDSTNGYRACRTELFRDERINIWQDWLDGTSWEFYVYLMVLKLGYRVVEAPVTKHYPKVTHKFNYNKSGGMTKTRPFIDWWRIMKPLFKHMLGILK